MPTPKYFKSCPEFPSDIPVTQIPIVSVNSLEKESNEPIDDGKRLFKACTLDGFFLLDLRDSELGRQLLRDAETMFDMNTSTFDLEPEVLKKYTWTPPKLFG